MLARFVGVLFMLAVAAFAANAAAAPPVASDVRIGEDGGATRLVIDLNAPVKFDTFVLADPYRVVIDFSDVRWSVPAADMQGHGLIKGFRFGQFRPGAARMVLDVAEPVVVAKAFLASARRGVPHRFVLDLKPTDRASFMADQQRDQSARGGIVRPIAAPAPPKVPRVASQKVVVIDPGHGGIDPGTTAADGLHEKIVTLILAKELQHRLSESGRYRVLLTRRDDSFVSLPDRVQFAREAHADIFISIHADSIHDKSIRGGTVYTLSQTASDKEAEELATDENKADLIAGVDLSGENDQVTSILIDLAQRETMNHSADLAQLMVGTLGQAVVMHHNGHRFAGFRVLKSPDVPSVLVEAGYLSNHQDEQMLRSPEGRTRIVEALARAVDRYFASGPKS